ncbi:MAG: dihydroneopterin aldolase [Coxiellaceae bacterium]|nr:dihydroneopterin aldolase [Coxiellaceae bacterium]
MDTLSIHQLKLMTLIGINPDERINPQMLTMDIVMQYDASHAIHSDDINHAINYANVTSAIEQLTQTTHFNLIEALAERTCELLLTKFPIGSITLTINKQPVDMPNIDHVSIAITRTCSVPIL